MSRDTYSFLRLPTVFANPRVAKIYPIGSHNSEAPDQRKTGGATRALQLYKYQNSAHSIPQSLAATPTYLFSKYDENPVLLKGRFDIPDMPW